MSQIVHQSYQHTYSDKPYLNSDGIRSDLITHSFVDHPVLSCLIVVSRCTCSWTPKLTLFIRPRALKLHSRLQRQQIERIPAVSLYLALCGSVESRGEQRRDFRSLTVKVLISYPGRGRFSGFRDNIEFRSTSKAFRQAETTLESFKAARTRPREHPS